MERRRGTLRALRLAAMGALFLGTLEVCARVDDALAWGAPLVGPYSNERLVFADELGQRCRPGARFEKWRLNNHGFRGPELAEPKPDGVVRVLVVGASETLGLYESEGHEYPAQLAAELERRQPGRFEVINAGCPGMAPPVIRHLLGTLFADVRPDVVVFYPSPQFYLDDEPPELSQDARRFDAPAVSLRVTRRAKAWMKGLLPSEVATRLRRWGIERAVAKHPAGWVWPEPPTERLELFREHLDDVLDRIEALGARPVLVTHASRLSGDAAANANLVTLRAFYPRASEAALVGFERAVNAAIAEAAARGGAALVDAAVLVHEPAELADYAHFTDAGASALALALADELERTARAAPPPGDPK